MLRDKYFKSTIKGKKHKVFLAFLLCTMIVFSPISYIYAKDAVSVGVVNVTFLMENAPQAEIASTELKSKFLPQEKKLAEDLDSINTLSIAIEQDAAIKASKELKRQKERELRSRKRARSRLLQDFREELRFARDAALDDVQKDVFAAINKVRERENIDIILQDYVSAAERVDITSLVLKYLQEQIDGKTTPNDQMNSEALGNKQ